jgi:KDO2-lipid IV(A) lauroyltransferase
MRLMAILPWPWAIRIHKLIGRQLGRLPTKQRRIVHRNLKICFPGRDTDALTLEFFENLCCFLPEAATAWFGSAKRLSRLVEIEGIEYPRDALESGKGVILITGHFTPLEIATPIIKQHLPLFAFMFSARSNLLLDEIQRRARTRAAHESFASHDVRGMIKSLKRNAAIWYAPDLTPFGKPGNGSVIVPFFGEPALTSTATSRIAAISGATVVPVHSYRKSDDSGYVVRFYPALEDFPSDDCERDARRIMQTIEEFVLVQPAQYLWNQKRFRGREPLYGDPYGKDN